MGNKVFKAIFAATMANTHVMLKVFYKLNGQTQPTEQALHEEVDKLYEQYYHRYDFKSGK